MVLAWGSVHTSYCWRKEIRVTLRILGVQIGTAKPGTRRLTGRRSSKRRHKPDSKVTMTQSNNTLTEDTGRDSACLGGHFHSS